MSCFIYYGHFYQLTIEGTAYCCRSTLEIVSLRNQDLASEAAQNSGVLLDHDHQPDAVFVMLNPGGSRPCDGQEPSNAIRPCQIGEHARSNLVPTRPDDTQKAVEKVMTCKRFDHVRVLNLFDIREPDSAELVSTIRTSLNCNRLPRQPEIKPYSIFSSERQCEFRNRLNSSNRIVIAAWGVEEARPFFRQCYQMLEDNDQNFRIHGWQPEDRRFYHPVRMRDEWARHIINNWPDEQDAPCQGQGAG